MLKKKPKGHGVAVMDVHEERALDEGASATNSQSEADVGVANSSAGISGRQ